MMPNTSRLAARQAVGTVLAAGAIALGLHHAAHFGLESPASLRPGDLVDWSNDVGPLVAAMTVLRLAAIAVSLYVTAVGLLVVLSSVCPSARSLRMLQRATPRILRRTLGVGALTALTLPAGLAASRTPPEAPPVMVQVDSPSPTTTAPPTTTPPSPEGLSTSTEPAEPAVPAVPSTAPRPSPEPSRWVVRPGDHFWSIATATLRDFDPSATEAEVTRYWRMLIDANRDRLVVPDDPDLVFAGQELVLPPVANQG